MSVDINKHEVDIDKLKKQNVNDFISIKILYRKFKEIEEKLSQIKYIDSNLTKKLKNEYENLKRVILDENVQIQLSNNINEAKTELTNNINEAKTELTNNINEAKTELTNNINEFRTQMDTKANQSEIDTLSSRMNVFTSLSQGSTTGDAELIDGRVGADGIIHNNIGGAIRSVAKGEGLLNKSIKQFNVDFLDGIYQYLFKANLTANKLYNKSGAKIIELDNSEYKIYKPFKVSKGKYILSENIFVAQSYLYDSDGNITRLKDYLDCETDFYKGKITFDKDYYIYLSTSNSFSNHMFYDYIEDELTDYVEGSIKNTFKSLKLIKENYKDIELTENNIIGGISANKLNDIVENVVFQYLKKSDIIDGKLYTSSNKITENSDYYIYPKITLESGTYYFNIFYGKYSFIKFSDGRETRFTDFLGQTELYYSGKITFSEKVDIYLSYYKNNNTDAMVSNFPISNSYFEGNGKILLNGNYLYINDTSLDKLVNKVDSVAGVKYDFYDLAFIKDCKLTCNNNYINSAGTVAKYIQANMESNVKKVMCRAYTTGGSIALISTKLNTKNYVNNITKSSIHIVFKTNIVDIGLFIHNSLEVIKSIRYSSELDTSGETEYELGYELLGNNTIKIYLPDGTTQEYTDSRIDNLNGQQVIYEHYMGKVEVTEEVTDNFGHPYFTGFYCTCESGIPLRDNFKRSNGPIGVAPSGHVYTLFRNTTEEDTVYDTSDGIIN